MFYGLFLHFNRIELVLDKNKCFPLALNGCVEHLDVSWNQLRRKGAVSLCNGLKVNEAVSICTKNNWFVTWCFMNQWKIKMVTMPTSFYFNISVQLLPDRNQPVLEWFGVWGQPGCLQTHQQQQLSGRTGHLQQSYQLGRSDAHCRRTQT